MQINRPGQKASPLGQAMNLVKVGAGLYSGGVGGALMAGEGAINLAGSTQKQPAQGLQSGDSSISRRLESQMPIADQVRAFRTVEQMMPDLPDDLKQEIGPPMFTAMAQLAQKVKTQRAGMQPGRSV